MLKINYCVLTVLFWKFMDGFGGMQSMNVLKLHTNIYVYIMRTFSRF